jgi:membrane-associated protein
MIGFLQEALSCFRTLDICLNNWAGVIGVWLYLALFLIIFCETGLVVTPFLPGDSLLFAVGALTAVQNSVLNLWTVAILLIIAAVVGDAVNYAIGYRLGPRVFTEKSRWLRQDYLRRTQDFYEKHGGKTIIIARFAPIIRTFAPFVAGIGKMKYSRFGVFNISGGIAWVLSFLIAGHFFGNLPWVKRRFQLVIMAIIVISLVPVALEAFKAWRERSAGKLATDKAA